jgi:hypothetical protein
MDDFNVSSLHESKNEWGARLLNILTPCMIDGFQSIWNEAHKLCKENDEMDKCLLTFQNLITRIPKWNPVIVEEERKRICEKSGCGYLEDLITCVHIIQLKILTCMRVGSKQKKIDLTIPKMDDFIHKAYINSARKIYKNVYLFEKNIPPLQIQKNQRELEIIVNECIMNTLRDSIPVETILKVYMDETVEEVVTEEIKEEVLPPEKPTQTQQPVSSTSSQATATSTENKETKQVDSGSSSNSSSLVNTNVPKLSFNDIDLARTVDNQEEKIVAPKTIERLDEISEIRSIQRKQDELEDEDDVKIKIIEDQNVDLNDLGLGIEDINEPEMKLVSDLLGDIEVLE